LNIMVKKIFMIVFAIFLLWQSYSLLIFIHNYDGYSLVGLIFVAWIINLFITGIFAFLGFALPTQKLLPDSFYKVYRPRLLKKVYNGLGVELFRKALLATLWKSKSQRKKFFNGQKNGIQNLEVQSMKSEFGHFIPLVIIFFVVIYLIGIGQFKLAFLTFLINIIGNLYPVLLQRYHRMRIQKIRKRQELKSAI